MDFQAFLESLKYMGIGMFGIFLVIGIIIGFIVALNRIKFLKAQNIIKISAIDIHIIKPSMSASL